jgi:L-ascorbate metabolism protein UlaG (beta-lactamase superfamily)
MRRCLILVLALLVTATTAAAGELKIAWYGQSMFLIVTPKGTRVVLDPHNIEEYRVNKVKADLVLMSHFHTDHTQMDVIENAKEAKQYNAMKKVGAAKDVDWSAVDTTFKDVKFQSITGLFHDDIAGMQRGKTGGWILDIDGVRIVHLGDLGHTLDKKQLKKLGTVDVLMVPAGGVYTIDGIRAFEVMEQVKPRRATIPMHYGTIIYNSLLPISYFTDECKENKVPFKKAKAGFFTIDTKSAVPKQQEVLLMDYNGEPVVIKLKDRDKKKDKEK